MRLRINQGWDMNFPDRAEFFWAQENVKATGNQGRGPGVLVRSIDFSDVSLYTEVAAGRAGLSVEVPYRRIEGDFSSSGFSDVIIGTKALLLDCPLLQIAFEFKTFIPAGQSTQGLGTGHVSLEPSLLWGVCLAPTTFLQAQTALWIPVGGDSGFQGNVFHYHFSLNQILWRPCPDLQLIGTAELNGWTFLNGLETDPTVPALVSARRNIMSAGPGIRFVICDKIDFGLGSAFSITEQRLAEEWLRFEFRWRF
jgi:hypothetical protein